MCGITGWIDWQKNLLVKKEIIEAMTATLENRGPDAEGTWFSTHCGLGHRRLSVVDPEGGSQPMIRSYGDKKYIIVYNGELYNTPELRKELESCGHHFHTRSDTEVLLVAYVEWKEDCVQKFNGIFAFAIWSESEQRLFMARDRVGVKPLFYYQKNDSFIFGSELKALLANPMVRPVLDEVGLAEIFAIGPARTPGHGVFNDVHELKPGKYLIHDRQGTHIRSYWKLENRPHKDDLETTAEYLRFLLQDSISRQLVADVPVCTLLSGGLDSSALTAFAAKYFNENGLGAIHTYSIDYQDNDIHFKANEFQPNADGPWIKLMTEFLGTKHQNKVIDTPELVEALLPAMRAHDRPCMADVESSLYWFCREIKKEATVALSGECADEVFGGYPWLRNQEALAADTFPWTRRANERLKYLSPELMKRIQPMEYLVFRYREALAEVPKLEGEDEQGARLREVYYLNITRFMSTLLDRKDRMSMGVGLEVRVPFCDHRIVDYAWNIPWEMKSCDGREKGILRKALQGVLPTEIIERRKSPYPKTHHPAYTAAVSKRLLQILEDSTSPLLPLINAVNLKNTINAGINSDSPWFGQLMGTPQMFAYLIQVDAWLREYKITIQ